MSSEEIIALQQRLETYRQNLYHYLLQRAQLGRSFEPPGVQNGIRDARINIAKIKASLRRRGQFVEDLEIDKDDDIDYDAYVQTLDTSSSSTQPAAPMPLPPATPPAPPADDLDYDPEQQAWYPHTFPQLKDIAAEDALKFAPDIAAVLLTVTDVEFRAVMQQLRPLPRRRAILCATIESETYYIGMFGSQQVVVTTSRMGGIRAGGATHATDRAGRLWHPRALFMIGIAFGADPSAQRIGDVLVTDRVIPYDPARVGGSNEQRGEELLSPTGLVNRFLHTYSWHFLRPDQTACHRHIGPVLSGEKLVDDAGFKARLLQQFPRAIGGEMEGAGLSASAFYINLPWILVKGICDWADGSKHKRHQPLAAAAATSLALSVLSRPDALNGLPKS